MMGTPTLWTGVVITCLTVTSSITTLASTATPSSRKSTTVNSFLVNCDWLRRSGQFTEYDLKEFCGNNGDSDAPAGKDVDKSTPSFQKLNDKTWRASTPRIQEWPVFKDWYTRRTTVKPLDIQNIDWNSWWTTAKPFDISKIDWHKDLDKWNEFTVPPIEMFTFAPPPHMWDGEDNNLSSSSSMFGTTGVIIGLAALITLAVALSLGIVYCCRFKQRQRRNRRQRLFLITARADNDDCEQFRHDMETTPPCVGLRVECPPSYEDALQHSNSPPEIVVEPMQAQEEVVSPPPYSAVVDSSFPSPNYGVDVTQVDTQADGTNSADLVQLQTPVDSICPEMAFSSQLVFKEDKE